ncbi:MAG: aspartate dehydrogenase domain-containing protein [archaeon]
MAKKIKLAIIGCGAIGKYVYDYASKRMKAEYDVVRVLDKNARAIFGIGNITDDFDEFMRGLDADIVLECASHAAVRDYAERVLESGKDLIVMSTGAFLLYDRLLQRLEKIAKEKNIKIYVPAGAFGGIDALAAAAVGKINRVRLETEKPKGSLKPASGGKPHQLKSATALEAVREYPRNVNIAATIAIAGAGKERKFVNVIPKNNGMNTHRLEVDGEFGDFVFRISSKPSENASTSAIAAMSAVACLKKIASPLQIG